MILRHTTYRKAAAGWNTPLLKHSVHTKSDELSLGAGGRASSTLTSRPARPANIGGTTPPKVSPYASISESQKLKKTQERDFLVTVLETSVTRRDAKAYMNKFVPFLERKSATTFKQRTAAQAKSNDSKPTSEPPSAIIANNAEASEGGSASLQASPKSDQDLTIQEPLFVALVKFRIPETVNDTTLDGVAKTLSRLRKLGLVSVVVVDCDGYGQDEITQRQTATAQARRIATAIDNYDSPGARVIDSPITIANLDNAPASPFTSQDLYIGNPNELMTALQDDLVAIIPSFGYTADTCMRKPVDVNDAILALTRQLSGLQFVQGPEDEAPAPKVLRSAEVYRIIILDPLGGIPARNRATGRHMFLNLEQEFQEVQAHLSAAAGPGNPGDGADRVYHLENARLARDALSLLPPTSSAIITTPQEAAKERRPEENVMDVALVGTRRGQNPLIHSLLTDKPVQSSSLPPERFTPITSSTGASQIGSLTTLAKRGMPLTIFPDPKISPWKPPQPGQSSLSLTDPCIDLSRLVHLINDSFGRKLDVEHYLKRVNGNLAGVIIAGEYEGGAILTWEAPPGTTDLSRRVPYLDKFAVLRKSQGVGGVADIVFNAMVRDCFPDGVCWRSRKDNPVNKWYFERSRGTLKFQDMNWTMFWTTPKLTLHDQRFDDYEAVCRGIEPSWADKKHIVD